MGHMTCIIPLTRIIMANHNYETFKFVATSKVNIEISDL